MPANDQKPMVECPVCLMPGLCIACGGYGEFIAEQNTRPYEFLVLCEECAGTGKCYTCNGTGKVVATAYDSPPPEGQ